MLSALERAAFLRDGFLVLRRDLSAELVAQLLEALESEPAAGPSRAGPRPSNAGAAPLS